MPNNGVLSNTRRRRNNLRSLAVIGREEVNGIGATVTVIVNTLVLGEQAVLADGVGADKGVLGHTRVALAASSINLETGRQMGHLRLWRPLTQTLYGLQRPVAQRIAHRKQQLQTAGSPTPVQK